ncbi:MAG: glycine/sarcosine/betaine reductase selenoprotein B family protein [Bacillota bacterium]
MLKQDAIEQAIKPFIVDNRNKEVPWTPMKEALSQAKVAVVTSAGIHLDGQEPFDIKAKEGDASYRELPLDTPLGSYRISHGHYDQSNAEKDINCVFPIARLKELSEEGIIGGISPVNFGFMGFVQKHYMKNCRKMPERLQTSYYSWV